jgi:hypothetical protein
MRKYYNCRLCECDRICEYRAKNFRKFAEDYENSHTICRVRECRANSLKKLSNGLQNFAYNLQGSRMSCKKFAKIRSGFATRFRRFAYNLQGSQMSCKKFAKVSIHFAGFANGLQKDCENSHRIRKCRAKSLQNFAYNLQTSRISCQNLIDCLLKFAQDLQFAHVANIVRKVCKVRYTILRNVCSWRVSCSYFLCARTTRNG